MFTSDHDANVSFGNNVPQVHREKISKDTSSFQPQMWNIFAQNGRQNNNIFYYFNFIKAVMTNLMLKSTFVSPGIHKKYV